MSPARLYSEPHNCCMASDREPQKVPKHRLIALKRRVNYTCKTTEPLINSEPTRNFGLIARRIRRQWPRLDLRGPWVIPSYQSRRHVFVDKIKVARCRIQHLEPTNR